METEWETTAEFAAYKKVTGATVRVWFNSNQLPGAERLPGGRIRIPKGTIVLQPGEAAPAEKAPAEEPAPDPLEVEQTAADRALKVAETKKATTEAIQATELLVAGWRSPEEYEEAVAKLADDQADVGRDRADIEQRERDWTAGVADVQEQRDAVVGDRNRLKVQETGFLKALIHDYGQIQQCHMVLRQANYEYSRVQHNPEFWLHERTYFDPVSPKMLADAEIDAAHDGGDQAEQEG